MKFDSPVRAFVTVILVAMIGGCEGSRSSNESAMPTATPSPVAEIPADWKTVDKRDFVFSLPPTMKEKKVKGIDTALWEFNAPNISLSIEAGFLGGDFSFVRDRYESSVQTLSVNGLKADRIVLDLNKPVLKNWSFNADGSTKVPTERQSSVVGLYFHDRETKFWLTRTPDVPLSTADIILNSIKFKE